MKETMKNLATAFCGESQARNRYTMYAKIASKEGYEKMADIFLETAEQEREHAGWLFKLMNALKEKGADPSPVKIEGEVPTVKATTIENLKSAIEGETHEYKSMYPDFAKVAEQEGLPDIARRLRMIGAAEKHHEERYTKLLKALEDGAFFKKSEKTWWVCKKCGFQHFGEEPPEKCPACDHERAYYSKKCEEY